MVLLMPGTPRFAYTSASHRRVAARSSGRINLHIWLIVAINSHMKRNGAGLQSERASKLLRQVWCNSICADCLPMEVLERLFVASNRRIWFKLKGHFAIKCDDAIYWAVEKHLCHLQDYLARKQVYHPSIGLFSDWGPINTINDNNAIYYRQISATKLIT